MKHIGLLCPLFSIPNEFGIGDFSDNSYRFIDYINTINYSTWQILPLNPTDDSNCPYSCLSSNALDDVYVSIPDLKYRKLINDFKVYSKRKQKKVNYKKVRRYKEKYWLEAYKTFINQDNYKSILEEFKLNEPWAYQYASYLILLKKNNYIPWNKWTIKELSEEEINNEVQYNLFKQYILFLQWNDLHEYAKKKGVTIIGDVPFYVNFDSSDVYYNKETFLLNEDNSPSLVSGVPPDYYSESGQLWGNPIYDWNYLKDHQYEYIINRLHSASRIYDVVRVDHFRAFDTYYVIDAKASDARVGEWREPPCYDFFDTLFNKYPNMNLIAEDLGLMREEVYHLRDHYNLPGMQVLQFTIIDEELRHQTNNNVFKRENSVVYLSTHDSETAMEWFNNQPEDIRNALEEYLTNTYRKHNIITNLFKYAANQPSNLVIFAVWDILRQGKSARLNIPGVVSKNNWTYRLKDFDGLNKNVRKLSNIAKEFNRH